MTQSTSSRQTVTLLRTMKAVLVLLLSFFIQGIRNAPHTPTTELLYNANDDIEILTIHNFRDKVENSPTAWVVEFYLTWCGDCQRFSPKWKKFSTEVASWSDIVKVGAIACSDPTNTPICKEMNVTGYPTVRYFPPKYQIRKENLGSVLVKYFPPKHQIKKENLGSILVFREQLKVHAIKKRVIEQMMSDISEGRGRIYPNLMPYEHSDLTQLFDGTKEETRYVFLVVEDPDSYLGAEVALDLHNTPGIVIKRSLNNNSDLITNLKIKNIPTLIVLDRDNNMKLFDQDVDTRTGLKATIGTFLESKGMKTVEIIPKNKVNIATETLPDPKQYSRTLLRHRIKKMGDVIFQMDLETTLRYSLKQEVAAREVIKGDQLEALKSYLKVIQKYFPFGYNSFFLINELTNLTATAEEVVGSQIEQLVKRAEENHLFSTPQRFLGCQGSTNRYRGYPCSLWRMFHYLSVNAALSGDKISPTEVLSAMHGYIKHFFGCTHCSQHFQEMAAERNITDVSSVEASVLWLWEAHNVVNNRLKGDVTEDPEYPKEQFPTKLRCPECYEDDGSWKRGEVLKYLKRMYGSYNIRYIGADTKILFPGLD